MIKCERGRTNPQKMKRKRATNILWYGECLCLLHCKHLYSWRRITQTVCIPSKIQKISQWNRCSRYLNSCHWNKQMRSVGVSTINLEDSSWKYLSLIGDEQVISLLHTKVFVFPDSVLCLGKMNENPQSNIAWEDRLTWFKSSPQYRTLDRLDGEPVEFEWNIFQDSPHCSSATKFMSSCQKCAKSQKNSLDGLSSCRCSMTSHGDLKKKSANQVLCSFLCAKRFSPGQWSFLGPGSEKKWSSTDEDSPQREWDRITEQVIVNICGKQAPSLPIHDSIIHRSAQKQSWWKMVNTLLRWPKNDWNCFRKIISVFQLRIYGAVSDMCEECDTCHDRTGRPVVAGQSNPLFVPSVMKTNIPSIDDLSQEDLLLILKANSRSPALPLEVWCSSTTSSTTRYCWSGYMWPHPWWRSPLCYLEHQGSRWVGSFFTKKQSSNSTVSGIRSHFGSRAISFSNVRGVCLLLERFWFCLAPMSTTQFCCSLSRPSALFCGFPFRWVIHIA